MSKQGDDCWSEELVVDLGVKLRDINRLKKKITFGNIPAFYHAVSTSLGLAEGMFRYGFENSLDLLLDKRNWNLKMLGGSHGPLGEIICEQSPRLSVYKVFSTDGFEIHCVPWLEDKEVDNELLRHPKMEFVHWNPGTMKVVFKVWQLHTFIRMYFDHGDEADLELIKFAHNIAEDFVADLETRLNVQKVYGISVRGFFEYAEKKVAEGEDVFLPRVYKFGPHT